MIGSVAWMVLAITVIFGQASPMVQNGDNTVECDDPDCYATAAQLIERNGYPVEEYKFTTSDGYILGIERIPPRIQSHDGCRRFPILLTHGLFRDSRIFVGSGKNYSLAFILADQGYDVWLFNFRGTPSSKGHLKVTTDDSSYWAFHFDKVIEIDVAGTIDFVLNKTNNSKLVYIGFSLGTTQCIALLSAKPEYNQKLHKAIFLAPTALLREDYTTNSMFSGEIGQLILAWFFQPLGVVYPTLQSFIADQKNPNLDPVRKLLVSKASTNYYEDPNINQSRIPVYGSLFPSAVAVNILIQCLQVLHANRLQKFDYGILNFFHYGQFQPPAYDTSKISVPIEMHSSVADKVSSPGVIAYLRKRLNSLIFDNVIPAKSKFSHGSFTLGMTANDLVYSKIVERLNKDFHCYSC